MIDDKNTLKKLLFKTDELDMRISSVEKKLSEKEEVKTVSYKATDLKMTDYFAEYKVILKTEKTSGVAVNIDFTSICANYIDCEVWYNGELVKTVGGNFPLSFSFPLIAKQGKNFLKVIIYDKSAELNYDFSVGVNFVGELVNQPIEPLIDLLENDFFIYKSGSLCKVVDGLTMESVIYESGYNDIKVACQEGSDVAFMGINDGGELDVKLFKGMIPNDCYTTYYNFKCADCDFILSYGDYRFFTVKGNYIYMINTSGGEIKSEVQLPIKAKKVKVKCFGSKVCLGFLDLNDNWWLSIIEDYEEFIENQRIFLGKLKALHFYECEGDIAFSYKFGAIVIEKLISNLSEERVLCDGDEAFRLKCGIIIKRKDDKYYAITEGL